ncbi:predicted protein [Lichtheimia corymbifera JMRC:FSU:9682]|uniref:Uncharacterized protein n=1 Tax=Lichtheimia corymbifera JMRC:FSU:9682 TaxID=1263082 RepID=A0A068SHP8_9FUNG|nr:predicted protein [Lichtheimia corymbifera JMRC:FSU:9682]
MPVSQIFTMRRGVFNRTELLVRGEAHLVCKFHDRRGHSQIHPMSPPASSKKKISRGRPVPLWLVVTLRNLGLASLIVKLGQHTLSTTTNNFVRLKTPRFIVKFRDTGTFMFYVCCQRDGVAFS